VTEDEVRDLVFGHRVLDGVLLEVVLDVVVLSGDVELDRTGGRVRRLGPVAVLVARAAGEFGDAHLRLRHLLPRERLDADEIEQLALFLRPLDELFEEFAGELSAVETVGVDRGLFETLRVLGACVGHVSSLRARP